MAAHFRHPAYRDNRSGYNLHNTQPTQATLDQCRRTDRDPRQDVEGGQASRQNRQGDCAEENGATANGNTQKIRRRSY